MSTQNYSDPRTAADDFALARRSARHAAALSCKIISGQPEQAVCQFTFSEGEYSIGPAFAGTGAIQQAVIALTSVGRIIERTVNYVDASGATRLNFILLPDGQSTDSVDGHALESEFGVLYDPRLAD